VGFDQHTATLWLLCPASGEEIRDQLATRDGRRRADSFWRPRRFICHSRSGGDTLRASVIGALRPTRVTLTCHWQHSMTWRHWVRQTDRQS